jgi:enoyl-CoA hydratase
VRNDHAHIAEQDGVLTVTIARPEKLNAISPQVTERLWEAVRALGECDELRCMLIAAEGKYFTAGLDLAAGGPRSGAPSKAPSAHRGWRHRRKYREHHLLYDEFEFIEKPVVMAIQGICLGAGVEMATSCDFRFCTPNAEFALPEVTLGVIPGSGGSSRLTRLVGPAWAKYMAMAGMRISAERALAIGLVQDIFPAETFMDEVQAFCRRLAGLPAEAMGLAKLAVDMSADVQDRTVQRHMDRIINTPLQHSEEHKALTSRFRKS